MERVWRIIHKPTGRYMPAPRNAMGVYATERGAKAGRTQLGRWLRASRGESIEDYEIQPYALLPLDEYEKLTPTVTITQGSSTHGT